MKHSHRSRGARPKRRPHKHKAGSVSASERRRWYADEHAAHIQGVQGHRRWERNQSNPDTWVWTVEAVNNPRGRTLDFMPVRVEQPEPRVPEKPNAARWRQRQAWLLRWRR